MSLAILHTESSCGWGGQELRILSEAAGFIRRGHRVELLCAPGSRIGEEAARFGVPAHVLPIGRKSLAGLLALRRWLAGRRYDVINTHSSTDSWLVALAQLLLPRAAPLVRTRHISAPLGNDPFSRWLYGRATAHVVTTGERLRESVIAQAQLSPGRVTSIPTGIDPQRYAPGERAAARARLGLSAQRPLVGIVATLRSWKGHLYLLEAIAALPQADLLVVGDGPMREVLEQKAAGLGIGQRVRFAGNQADVRDWLQALDVFALPSYANEGVPQALMQAMLTGLPCVTTDVGSIGEIAIDGRTARLVPARDAQALAAAIGELLADPALARRLGEAARSHVAEHYSEGRMLDRMGEVFAGVAGARAEALPQGRRA